MSVFYSNPKNVSSKKFSQRQRGIFLSAHGRKRLRDAIRRIEQLENEGRPFLTKELSQRVGISEATISRVWTGDLCTCFSIAWVWN